uniref:Uncharacterized protein n=1 Tax=Kalanchoe fedtschenkoi TaxID=63787 RepID=A0A7N0TRR9_KALFE
MKKNVHFLRVISLNTFQSPTRPPRLFAKFEAPERNFYITELLKAWQNDPISLYIDGYEIGFEKLCSFLSQAVVQLFELFRVSD